MIFECLAYKWNDDDNKVAAIEEIVAGPEVIASSDVESARLKFAMAMEKEWGTAFDADEMRILIRPFVQPSYPFPVPTPMYTTVTGLFPPGN